MTYGLFGGRRSRNFDTLHGCVSGLRESKRGCSGTGWIPDCGGPGHVRENMDGATLKTGSILTRAIQIRVLCG